MMVSLRKFLHFLSWGFLIFFSTSTFAKSRLGRIQWKILPKQNSTNAKPSLVKDVKVLYYPQTLDHFNYQPESYTIFKQKYIIYSKHWGGAKAYSPIFVHLGDEEPLADSDIDDSILPEYGATFNALVVLIEHRFYGESKPFGMSSMEEVLKNASVRGYFNSAQAIADYAELILHLRESLNAHFSPIIVVGGSDGGMLASWFRLKYPHIALGALASSAPVLYFDKMILPDRGYDYVISKSFKEASESCYRTIKKSWAEIDRIGSKPTGLSFLSQKFNTCAHLNETDELKNVLETIYELVTQYGSWTKNASTICSAIDQGRKGSDLLSRIQAGAHAYFEDPTECLDTNHGNTGETIIGYAWQTCSEMVMPAVSGTSNNSMFPHKTFDLQGFIQNCKDQYKVAPRPHWITSYYGGHDMKLILERFGSNIIFSNGLKDPYSSAGVLKNLSDSIVAVYTTSGSHCQDISASTKDDPNWLVNQRKREVEIINGWIKNYYEDLKNYKK